MVSLGAVKEAVKPVLDDAKLNPLTIPSAFCCVESMPKLGSGNTAFNAVKHLAAELDGA
jgi:hypothetical protein